MTGLRVFVTIIGVLVAISIPIFTSQLEKSRDAVTLSNIRAAYAQAQTAYLTESSDTANGVTYTQTASGKSGATVTVANVEAKGQTGTIDNFEELPFATLTGANDISAEDSMGGTPGKYTLTFTYSDAGALTGVSASK